MLGHIACGIRGIIRTQDNGYNASRVELRFSVHACPSCAQLPTQNPMRVNLVSSTSLQPLAMDIQPRQLRYSVFNALGNSVNHADCIGTRFINDPKTTLHRERQRSIMVERSLFLASLPVYFRPKPFMT